MPIRAGSSPATDAPSLTCDKCLWRCQAAVGFLSPPVFFFLQSCSQLFSVEKFQDYFTVLSSSMQLCPLQDKGPYRRLPVAPVLHSPNPFPVPKFTYPSIKLSALPFCPVPQMPHGYSDSLRFVHPCCPPKWSLRLRPPLQGPEAAGPRQGSKCHRRRHRGTPKGLWGGDQWRTGVLQAGRGGISRLWSGCCSSCGSQPGEGCAENDQQEVTRDLPVHTLMRKLTSSFFFFTNTCKNLANNKTVNYSKSSYKRHLVTRDLWTKAVWLVFPRFPC